MSDTTQGRTELTACGVLEQWWTHNKCRMVRPSCINHSGEADLRSTGKQENTELLGKEMGLSPNAPNGESKAIITIPKGQSNPS